MRYILIMCAAALCLDAQPMHLTLADAQREAIQNNPRFSAAKFTAAAAYQLPLEYRAAYQPSVAGSFTGVGADNGSRLAAGGLNNPVVYNRLGSGLTVAQMITDFGRTGNLVGSARLQAQAQDQATETTRAEILLNVSRAYFNILRAEAVRKVAIQTVAARQLVSDQVSALAQSKLRSTLDVSFAKVNLSDAKLLQVQAENDYHAAEATFAEAMGLPGLSGFTVEEEPLPAGPPDTVGDLLREAMNNRPELKELRLQESAQQRFTKAEHGLYYPTIGVLGTAGFAPAGYETISSRYGAIGLNVNIPVFNGGLFKARETASEMKARAVSETAKDVQNQVSRDVRIAWLNSTTAYDRMALTKELLDQARLALDLAQSRYDLGLASIVELSTAQLNLTSAQISDANARYDYQTQKINLDFQTGILR